MKAKDLRIGNRFNWSELASMGVFEDFVTMDNIKYHEFMEPIPLNEEWMMKFGFKQFVKGFWQKNDGISNVSLSLKSGYYCLSFVNYGNIQFVHQLQNLYYALTNEELTIK